MGRPRYAVLTDENHKKIKQRFEEWGCTVVDWNGVLDLIIGKWGITELIEVKNPERSGKREKQLTKNQRNLLERWRGRPIKIVESVGDVDRIVVEMNRERT